MAGLINLAHVRQGLALCDFDAKPARKRMAPVPRGWQKRDTAPAQAAVMLLLYQDGQERLHLVLTLRHAGLRGHSGQVSFPGGRQEPQDKTLTDTAIRETGEEIGICRDAIRSWAQCQCSTFQHPTMTYIRPSPIAGRCRAFHPIPTRSRRSSASRWTICCIPDSGARSAA